MQLLAEFTEGVECLTEVKDGEKKYYIEGIFAQAEKKNRNGRVYKKGIMESAVDKYVTEQVSQKRAVGELNHPSGPTVNLDKVSHLITDLRWEGNNVIGKATILDTPMGRIVKSLLDEGVVLGVSTRGMGSLESNNGVQYVNSDFQLNTVDIVQDPSAHEAFVKGINEGIEWVDHNGIYCAQVIEKMETEVSAPIKGSYESQVREFKNFLSFIKQNFKE